MAGAEVVLEGQLSYFRTKHAVVLIRTPTATYKVARVTFGGDGSVYVQFPYLVAESGIIAELPVDPAITGPVTYDLAKLGETVDTDVKFSHHASGEVRFSKTGHRITTPPRQSFRLDGPIGRVFELNAYHLFGFREFTGPEKRIAYLGFNFNEGIDGVLIRAEWRRKAGIVANIHPPGGVAGPGTTTLHRRTGAEEAVYFVGAPTDTPFHDHLLIVSSSRTQLPTGATIPSMIFLGGWDPHERRDNEPPGRLGNCLAFLYPAASAPSSG